VPETVKSQSYYELFISWQLERIFTFGSFLIFKTSLKTLIILINNFSNSF